MNIHEYTFICRESYHHFTISNVNPGFFLTPNGCLIGRVPFKKKKYQIMTIGGVPPY